MSDSKSPLCCCIALLVMLADMASLDRRSQDSYGPGYLALTELQIGLFN